MVLRNLVKAAAGAALGSVIAEKSAGRGLLGAGIGIAATRLASRSIPGALLVGGAFVAKKLYDKRKEQKQIEAAIPSAIASKAPTFPPTNR